MKNYFRRYKFRMNVQKILLKVRNNKKLYFVNSVNINFKKQKINRILVFYIVEWNNIIIVFNADMSFDFLVVIYVKVAQKDVRQIFIFQIFNN